MLEDINNHANTVRTSPKPDSLALTLLTGYCSVRWENLLPRRRKLCREHMRMSFMKYTLKAE